MFAIVISHLEYRVNRSNPRFLRGDPHLDIVRRRIRQGIIGLYQDLRLIGTDFEGRKNIYAGRGGVEHMGFADGHSTQARENCQKNRVVRSHLVHYASKSVIQHTKYRLIQSYKLLHSHYQWKGRYL